jgi:hypothetical protein
VAAKAGGKQGGANAKRRENFVLQKIGFNKPDLLNSGSISPIIMYRVQIARFSEIGFNHPDYCFFYFSFSITAQKAQNKLIFGFPNPDFVISGSSNPIS